MPPFHARLHMSAFHGLFLSVLCSSMSEVSNAQGPVSGGVNPGLVRALPQVEGLTSGTSGSATNTGSTQPHPPSTSSQAQQGVEGTGGEGTGAEGKPLENVAYMRRGKLLMDPARDECMYKQPAIMEVDKLSMAMVAYKYETGIVEYTFFKPHDPGRVWKLEAFDGNQTPMGVLMHGLAGARGYNHSIQSNDVTTSRLTIRCKCTDLDAEFTYIAKATVDHAEWCESMNIFSHAKGGNFLKRGLRVGTPLPIVAPDQKAEGKTSDGKGEEGGTVLVSRSRGDRVIMDPDSPECKMHLPLCTESKTGWLFVTYQLETAKDAPKNAAGDFEVTLVNPHDQTNCYRMVVPNDKKTPVIPFVSGIMDKPGYSTDIKMFQSHVSIKVIHQTTRASYEYRLVLADRSLAMQAMAIVNYSRSGGSKVRGDGKKSGSSSSSSSSSNSSSSSSGSASSAARSFAELVLGGHSAGLGGTIILGGGNPFDDDD